jgi:hypothetical protein
MRAAPLGLRDGDRERLSALTRIARHTAELIELGRDLRDDEIQVLEGWAGDLYGIPVDSTMETSSVAARSPVTPRSYTPTSAVSRG